MTQFDCDFVRSQCPAFSEPTLQGWAFFENTGGSYPVAEIAAKVRRAGVILVVDGISYAPHGLPDVEALQIDADHGVLRLSFLHCTAPDEIDQLIEALDRVL